MRYSGYELLWLFLTISFLGWIAETVLAAIKKKHFVNRGLVNGPFCIIYGFTAVANAVVLQELTPFWVFIGAFIQATVIEWSAGHILEWMGHGKWWDYSNFKWNLDGYVCVPASLLWGVLGTVGVLWANDWLIRIYHLIPRKAGMVILWCILVVLCADIAATAIILSGKTREIQKWKDVDNWLTSITTKLEDRIYSWVSKRLDTAHPHPEKAAVAETPDCFSKM